MKKHVRFLALLLAAMLILAGCSGDAEDVGGQITPAEDATQANVAGTVVPETTAPDAESPVSLGRLEGGVYINEYAGYACELDANWQFYTAEELQELPENVAELLEGSELAESGNFLTQITDMMAENVNDMTTINVLYQKLGMQERLAYATLDEKAILELTLEQKDAMIDAYAQAGIAVNDMAMTTVTFLGEERTALLTSSTVQDVPYYTLQIFDFHLGQYSVTLTLASYVEDNTARLLELFYAVE